MKVGDKLRITASSLSWRMRHGSREATVTAVSGDTVQIHWHHTAEWYAVRGRRLVRQGEWIEYVEPNPTV